MPKYKRNDFPIKLEIIDLEELPDNIDISIGQPEKKPSEAAKTPKFKKPKDTIALF